MSHPHRLIKVCRVHQHALHFWTVLVASFLDFSFFSLVYWGLVIKLQMPITKRIKVGISAGFYSAAAASALGALVWGWKSPSFQALLFNVSDARSPSRKMVLTALQIFHLLIIMQFSIRRFCTEEGLATPARKNYPESIPREPYCELKDISKRHTDIGIDRPSTASTSKRALTGDSDDPKELYALSLSEIQLGKREGKGVGGTIPLVPVLIRST